MSGIPVVCSQQGCPEVLRGWPEFTMELCHSCFNLLPADTKAAIRESERKQIEAAVIRKKAEFADLHPELTFPAKV